MTEFDIGENIHGWKITFLLVERLTSISWLSYLLHVLLAFKTSGPRSCEDVRLILVFSFILVDGFVKFSYCFLFKVDYQSSCMSKCRYGIKFVLYLRIFWYSYKFFCFDARFIDNCTTSYVEKKSWCAISMPWIYLI